MSVTLYLDIYSISKMKFTFKKGKKLYIEKFLSKFIE
ncbi:MAG: hypothetical protein A370_04231 [Clostridium sp. Maddingley MBC34-26]|nr:MAG: hypothetical protein A370_04231 [Clostridium sp. Maddingley MBC34-26]